MIQIPDLLIRDGTCAITPASAPMKLEKIDLLLSAGRIVEIGSGLSPTPGCKVIDARGLHVLPGAIDSQVHFREPGLTHKEDLESGTRAAVLGGVTAVFEMPNTKPPTASRAAFEHKVALAAKKAWCDYAFFVGATANNLAELAQLELLPGCCGVKIFMGSSTGDLLVAEDGPLLNVLRSGKRRVAVHCEDEERLRARYAIAQNSGQVMDHINWRDEETALRATQRIVKLAREANRPIHILHVTTRQELEFLTRNKDIATVECTPQHLTLQAPDCYQRLGTFAQMNPPIRTAEHREALWKAVADGTIDVIGSDHAPHTREEKSLPYPQSPSGMTGVQTLLPVMLDHVSKGRLNLLRLVELISTHPATIYGQTNRGSIAPGRDASLTVVDLNLERIIEDSWIASKSQWTPFHGRKVRGWPKMTIIGGRMVMCEDQVIGHPQGRAVHFT